MAECIISRAAGQIPEEVLNPVYPSESFHKILCTLKSPDNISMSNVRINCRDGSAWYNYTTNEKGQVLFTCNSGAADIYINNTINGIVYKDITNTSYHVDAPLGEVTRLNAKFNLFYGDITVTTGFYTLTDRLVNIIIVGGGGGSSLKYSGGSGYPNSINNIILDAGYTTFKAGSAGRCNEWFNRNMWNAYNIVETAGGTSVLTLQNGFQLSAIGGGAGNDSSGVGIGWKNGKLAENRITSNSNGNFMWVYVSNGGASIIGGYASSWASVYKYYAHNGDTGNLVKEVNGGNAGYGGGGAAYNNYDSRLTSGQLISGRSNCGAIKVTFK